MFYLLDTLSDNRYFFSNTHFCHVSATSLSQVYSKVPFKFWAFFNVSINEGLVRGKEKNIQITCRGRIEKQYEEFGGESFRDKALKHQQKFSIFLCGGQPMCYAYALIL